MSIESRSRVNCDNSVTIVMYHYVRDLQRTRFPQLKGLTTDDFREQLAYIKRNYNVIGAEELMAAVSDGHRLPPHALLLTFDDGYVDHFHHVFPILDRDGLPACFFPTATAAVDRRVLDVNRIQFILASAPRFSDVLRSVLQLLDRHRAEYGLHPTRYYWNKLAVANQWDSKDVIFVKRLLQRELPPALRTRMLRSLFAEYVTADEASFADELYANLDQLECMRRHGMYIGAHGDDHAWLDAVPPEEQERQVDRSLRLLRAVGTPADRWLMCYPYGGFDESLLSILQRKGCAAGLTVDPRVARIARVGGDEPLKLPRLDANAMPRIAGASDRPRRITVPVAAVIPGRTAAA